MVTWDDHDAGMNDCDATNPYKNLAKAAFLDFFQVPGDDERRARDGVYYSKVMGVTHARTRARTRAHTHTHTHTRTRAHAHTLAHAHLHVNPHMLCINTPPVGRTGLWVWKPARTGMFREVWAWARVGLGSAWGVC